MGYTRRCSAVPEATLQNGKRTPWVLRQEFRPPGVFLSDKPINHESTCLENTLGRERSRLFRRIWSCPQVLDWGTGSTVHSGIAGRPARRSLSKFLKDIISLRTGGMRAARAYARAKPKAATRSCEQHPLAGNQVQGKLCRRIPSTTYRKQGLQCSP